MCSGSCELGSPVGPVIELAARADARPHIGVEFVWTFCGVHRTGPGTQFGAEPIDSTLQPL